MYTEIMKVNLKVVGLVAFALVWFSITRVITSRNNQHPDSIDPAAITGEYDPSQTNGTFNGVRVAVPPFRRDSLAAVLGDTNSEKRIEVDLTNQRVYAFEGNRKVYEFTVSTGKWGRTPTGTFRIWGKSRFQNSMELFTVSHARY